LSYACEDMKLEIQVNAEKELPNTIL